MAMPVMVDIHKFDMLWNVYLSTICTKIHLLFNPFASIDGDLFVTLGRMCNYNDNINSSCKVDY